jgi:hypothetical protein
MVQMFPVLEVGVQGSGSELRISGFGSRMEGLLASYVAIIKTCLWASVFGFRVSNFGFRVSGFRVARVLGFLRDVVYCFACSGWSKSVSRGSGFRFRISGF